MEQEINTTVFTADREEKPLQLPFLVLLGVPSWAKAVVVVVLVFISEDWWIKHFTVVLELKHGR
ncbi:MAG: hypothetical protein V3V10_07660 [Planctomycetota bacterium]